MVINSIATLEPIYRQIKHLWVTGSPELKPSLSPKAPRLNKCSQKEGFHARSLILVE